MFWKSKLTPAMSRFTSFNSDGYYRVLKSSWADGLRHLGGGHESARLGAKGREPLEESGGKCSPIGNYEK